MSMSKSSMSVGTDSNGAGEGSFSALYGKSQQKNKKFRFTGLVEFRYLDYSVQSNQSGNNSKTSRRSFEQYYKLGLTGYIYDPRLALFSSSITYQQSKPIGSDTSGINSSSKDITYELMADFFPNRPINISAFAIRTTYTYQGNTASGNDAISNYYGARISSSYRRLPDFIFEYSHWDHSSDRSTGSLIRDEFDFGSGLIIEKKTVRDKYSIDKFSLDTKGSLKPINTKYRLSFDYSIHSHPFRNFTAEYISLSTATILKKDSSIWSDFRYSGIDTSKLINFATTIRLSPIFRRLYHSYNLEYLSSESADNKSNTYSLASFWRYKLSNKIYARLDLHYSFGTENGANTTTYNLNSSINYSRPIKGFDFNSSYAFSLSDEEKSGQFKYVEHNIVLGLSTRGIRWARIYSNYNFRYSSFDLVSQANTSGTDLGKSEQFNEMEHKFRFGINGKGLLRTNWTVEGEARYISTSDGQFNAWRTVWEGDRQWGQKVIEYTLRGDLRYPLRRRGIISFGGSYTTGETNSVKTKKYYYEGRLRYNITRNLSFLAWWRTEWKDKGWLNYGTLYNTYTTGTKTRDYEIDLYYAWRAVTLSVEFTSTKEEQEENSESSETKRLSIILRRPF